MTKIRRIARYEKLRKVGFLPFEAEPLSKVPFYIVVWKGKTAGQKIPYMERVVRERRKLQTNTLKAARERGLTKIEWGKAWKRKITELYNHNRWLKRNKAGQLVPDPWAMLRDFEDRFKHRTPEYESPWQPRQRDYRKDIAKLEETLRRQRGLSYA